MQPHEALHHSNTQTQRESESERETTGCWGTCLASYTLPQGGTMNQQPSGRHVMGVLYLQRHVCGHKGKGGWRWGEGK